MTPDLETADARLRTVAITLQKHFGSLGIELSAQDIQALHPDFLWGLYPYDGSRIATNMKARARTWLRTRNPLLWAVHNHRLGRLRNAANQLQHHLGSHYLYNPPRMQGVWEIEDEDLGHIFDDLNISQWPRWRKRISTDLTEIVQLTHLKATSIPGSWEVRQHGYTSPATTFEQDLADFELLLTKMFHPLKTNKPWHSQQRKPEQHG